MSGSLLLRAGVGALLGTVAFQHVACTDVATVAIAVVLLPSAYLQRHTLCTVKFFLGKNK